jgi:hypothetical protein
MHSIRYLLFSNQNHYEYYSVQFNHKCFRSTKCCRYTCRASIARQSIFSTLQRKKNTQWAEGENFPHKILLHCLWFLLKHWLKNRKNSLSHRKRARKRFYDSSNAFAKILSWWRTLIFLSMKQIQFIDDWYEHNGKQKGERENLSTIWCW